MTNLILTSLYGQRDYKNNQQKNPRDTLTFILLVYISNYNIVQ